MYSMTIPLLICISIRLGRNPLPIPLTIPDPGCTDPVGMAPKLVAGWKGRGCRHRSHED